MINCSCEERVLLNFHLVLLGKTIQPPLGGRGDGEVVAKGILHGFTRSWHLPKSCFAVNSNVGGSYDFNTGSQQPVGARGGSGSEDE